MKRGGRDVQVSGFRLARSAGTAQVSAGAETQQRHRPVPRQLKPWAAAGRAITVWYITQVAILKIAGYCKLASAWRRMK